MLIHFVLAVFLSQAVITDEGLSSKNTGVFEQAFHSVEYTYPAGR